MSYFYLHLVPLVAVSLPCLFLMCLLSLKSYLTIPLSLNTDVWCIFAVPFHNTRGTMVYKVTYNSF